ncbi:MAG: hypothetical protein EOM42_07515 [Negativicutes bacterium]|nr:hypothetical protein [Negativicutes bacterium]
MGFWDSVESAFKKGYDKMEKIGKEADEKYVVFIDYPDHRLIQMIKNNSGSMADRMAARKILQERGIIEKQ